MKRRWSWGIKEYGRTVRVWEEQGSGRLYAKVAGKKFALTELPAGARDAAKRWAKDEAKRIRTEAERPRDQAVPTAAHVFAEYLTSQTPRKGSSCQYEDRRAVRMWTRVLGAAKDLRLVTLGEWQEFIAWRRSGAIDAQGQPVPEQPEKGQPTRRPVGARTIEADLEWLHMLLGWATRWQDRQTGQYLMKENPVRGEAFQQVVPHEENPRRPVATDDRYDQVRAVAAQVDARLPVLLTLVHGTGRRIRAILALRHEDLLLAKGDQWPHGRIRWRAEEDKIGKEWIVPMAAEVRAALDRLPRAIGPVPLFGFSYDLASKWLRRAERLAEVPKHDGSLWHAYRRGWATARKHLSAKDVAFAGGWKNTATLQSIYQQPDAESTYRAVAEPLELREGKG